MEFEWVLPAARDWAADRCYFIRPKRKVPTPVQSMSKVEQFAPFHFDSDSEISLREEEESEPNPLDELYIKSMGVSRKYKMHLPALRGHTSVNKELVDNQDSTLVCIVTTTALPRAAFSDAFNAELAISFKDGAGNVKNGRITVKKHNPLADSFRLFGSGDISEPGDGFRMELNKVTGYLNSLEVMSYGNYVSFSSLGADPLQPHTCDISIATNNPSAEEVNSKILALASGVDNSKLVFQLALAPKDDKVTPSELSDDSPVDLTTDEHKLFLLRNINLAEKVVISCPTVGVEKRFAGLPTVMNVLGVSDGIDVTAYSFIHMDNSALGVSPLLFAVTSIVVGSILSLIM